MPKRDYYEILGISKSATKQQIKSAYRKLAKQYHPDRNKAADAETKFKEVQEAYEVLSDDQKRSAYDKYGHAATQGFGGGNYGYGPDMSGFGFDTSGMNGGFDFGDMGGLNDIFEQFFGAGFGGFSSGTANRPVRGRDIETKLTITFNEAVFGTTKTIRYKRHIVCTRCKGSGAKNDSSIKTCPTCKGQGRVSQVQQTFLGNIRTVAACPECHGTGKIIKEPCPVCKGAGIFEKDDDFKIKIPQGIPDDVTLRFHNQGHAGSKGGSYGDLYINIEVTPDERFERRGNDIYTNIKLDAVSAVLGTEVTIPTVHGKEKLKIQSGTQPNAVIKMPGRGAPKFRGSGNGDQYVRVGVEIPKKLSRDQKKLWEQLNETKGQKGGFMGGFF